MQTLINSHEKIAFHFSGGKDSIACLQLLTPYLDKIIVMWVDSGESFPETLAQMEKVKALCPNFMRVLSNVKSQVESRGFPVDILPLKNALEVQEATQTKSLPLQSFLTCCATNLMNPLHEATVLLGVTLIIRGQKLVDPHRSSLRHGQVVGGFQLCFPLENWTDEEVLAFVKDNPLLPEHYGEANTSLDCWSCTAYLKENQWKLRYMQKYHPEKAVILKHRLQLIKKEIVEDLNYMGVCDE